MPTIHLIIQGLVQGVFYRASAKEKALFLGLTGWVKNTKEGDVEIMATGDPQKLDKLREWCWQGPSQSRVTNVISEVLQEEEMFHDFSIQR
jgi:acylphosphatase